MRKTKILMGMPITVEVADKNFPRFNLEEIFEYFQYVDDTFSTYKSNSEISLINQGKIRPHAYSLEMKQVFRLAEQTKQETKGYFDIYHDGQYDPSGLVKGWAIFNAAKMLEKRGLKHFYVEAGGDIQTAGNNLSGKKWQVGIKNPFNVMQIIKAVSIQNQGVATSGNYLRGEHIYNPHGQNGHDIVSLTVIGPNIYEADRFCTAAFAMGREGIAFIENLDGFEGYMVDKTGIATITSGFPKYEID